VEALIRAGRVTHNGRRVEDLATTVDPARDRVEVDGRPVGLVTQGRLVLLHKPVGVVSSLRRHGSERCLLDLLPSGGSRLFHVGRLDRDSSGLLLLTDDGGLAQRLQHPRGEVWKTYTVRTATPLDDDALERLRAGDLDLDGRPCLPMRVTRTGPRDLVLGLREGRNRQIRRVVELLGSRVERLHRTAVGTLELGTLAAGESREASAEERAELESQLGSGDD